MPKKATDANGNTFEFEGDLTISGIVTEEEWNIHMEDNEGNTEIVKFIGGRPDDR